METPLVSVVIPAYNEGKNIRKSIDSLMNQTMPPGNFEILVVDNNSTDDTWEIISQLPVRAIKQPLQGTAHARQKGLEEAKGKYILSADADAFYPREWIERMSRPLIENEKISCVYSKHRFLPEPGFSRFKLFLLHSMRDMLVLMKSFKRPWLNCGGASMGYRREYALAIGYDPRSLRGEDGRLAYDLTRYGRIKKVNAPVFTPVRTLKQDGNMVQVIFKRIKRELPYLLVNLTNMKDHDTKTSTNSGKPGK